MARNGIAATFITPAISASIVAGAQLGLLRRRS
jgi:hypothetical protein